jgi:hypothetical protein
LSQGCLNLQKGTCLKQVCIFEFTWFPNLCPCFSGYKLCIHIATALRACSQAIYNALERYNTAASVVSPPHPNLSWDDVVEYVFLADFDLLRESRQDIHDRPWSKLAYRVMIDQYFKLKCAREEIQCLNVEIPQVITYIWDEDIFLPMKESEVREENPGLAHQIEKHRLERGHSNEQHMCRFRRLASLPAFSGSIQPGISVESCQGVEIPMDVDGEVNVPSSNDQHMEHNGDGEGNEEDEEDDQIDADITATVSALMLLTLDSPQVNSRVV